VKVQSIFITIDPERDTPEAIDAYVKTFDSRIIGLSGTPEEIAQVAREYRVHYAKKAAADGDPKTYLMEHSAFIYLAGPDGKYLTLFMPTRGQGPDDIAATLRQHIAPIH
jgi:protein SCO1/2